jgi:hypothetical protein
MGAVGGVKAPATEGAHAAGGVNAGTRYGPAFNQGAIRLNAKKTWGPHNLKRGPKTDKITDRERLLALGIAGGLTKKAALQKAGYASSQAGDDSILERPRFVRYLKYLRDRQVERLDYSIDNLCARLEYVHLEAVNARQFGAAVQAILGIGKMMGHMADRTEIEMHIISKPMREPTHELTLSPDEWQRQFAPKRIQ